MNYPCNRNTEFPKGRVSCYPETARELVSEYDSDTAHAIEHFWAL